MVGKPALVPFILAAIPGTSAATVAQASLEQFPSGILEAVIATEEAKLTGSDAAAGDRFGLSVSIFGDTAVVGAPRDDHAGGTAAGSAYVFVRTGRPGAERRSSSPATRRADDHFGLAWPLAGDRSWSARRSDEHPGGAAAGSVYVFVRSGTTWSEQQKLVASDASGRRRLRLLGRRSWARRSLVGASSERRWRATTRARPTCSCAAGRPGARPQKLTASDAAAGDLVRHRGRPLRATRPWSGRAGTITRALANAGSAYVFVRERHELERGAEAHRQRRGRRRLLRHLPSASPGDTAVVGRLQDDHPGAIDAGSAYVFVRSGTTWSEAAEARRQRRGRRRLVRLSVRPAGDMAVVGASQGRPPGRHRRGLGLPCSCADGTSLERRGQARRQRRRRARPLRLLGRRPGDTAVVGADEDDHTA